MLLIQGTRELGSHDDRCERMVENRPASCTHREFGRTSQISTNMRESQEFPQSLITTDAHLLKNPQQMPT